MAWVWEGLCSVKVYFSIFLLNFVNAFIVFSGIGFTMKRKKWNYRLYKAEKVRRDENEVMNVKEKFMRFMQGRYGVYGPDLLNRFLMGMAMALMILSLFVRRDVVYWTAFALLAYAYFRMFSKNYSKRYAENQAFVKHTAKLRGYIGIQKNMMRQRKTHHIYKCPGCGQKIRIPRGKGKIAVRCPKCGAEFIKKS